LKRVKRRYLALQLESEGMPAEREFMDAVWASVTKLYGEVGASLTGLALINFDVERKIFVVRTSLASLHMVRASLATVTSVAGRGASMHVLAVSGTLKALYANVG
jgi:ribonuclease P/MRP protein subunit POP5